MENDDLCLRDDAGAAYRYHPNLFLVRGLNVLRGMRDLFLHAATLAEGESVLDCTAGFGCEAALAALAVGEKGSVVALESVPELAVVTREGLGAFALAQKPLREAMRRVNLCVADYRDYLPRAPSRSFDIVSFDPFFGTPLPGSAHNVNPLASFGNLAPLSTPAVLEAQRVARRCVLIKHPKEYPLPPDIASAPITQVASRRGPIVYTILPAF